MEKPGSSTPVRKAEVRSTQSNPDGAVAPLSALRSVVLFTITDVFGLVPEEVMWAGYHLDKILAPLMDKKPGQVPLAVRQEMLDGTYSAQLDRIEARDNRNAAVVFDPRVAHASAPDWAAVFIQMVTVCYPMRPLEESMMHGQIVGLLRELGVDDPINPRAARYLPNDIRHRLNNRPR